MIFRRTRCSACAICARRLKLSKVLLFAHSGGGPLLSYYEAAAEDGASVCNGPSKLVPCTDKDVKGLVKADGMIFFDAHPGTAINLLRSLDPSIVREDDPKSVNAALDPFSEANGYNPHGMSHYSDAFKKSYFKAQADRMNRLIADATKKRDVTLTPALTNIPMMTRSSFHGPMRG